MPCPDRRQKIEDTFSAAGDLLQTQVRQLLGEDYSYEELKMVGLGLI